MALTTRERDLHEYTVDQEQFLRKLRAIDTTEAQIQLLRANTKVRIARLIDQAKTEEQELRMYILNLKRGVRDECMVVSHERQARSLASDNKGRKVWPPAPWYHPVSGSGPDTTQNDAKNAALKAILDAINARCPGARPTLTVREYDKRVRELDHVEQTHQDDTESVQAVTVAAAVASGSASGSVSGVKRPTEVAMPEDTDETPRLVRPPKKKRKTRRR